MSQLLDALVIEPPGPALRALVGATSHASAPPPALRSAALLGRPLMEWRALTRRELGLPDSRPVVMAGHQAAFWHPGIVTKSLLAEVLAEALGGVAAHVVVEQDVEPIAAVAVPVRTSDGELHRTIVSFLRQPAEVMAGALPAFEPGAVPEIAEAVPGVSKALRSMHEALRRHRGATNAAMQVTCAAFDLLPIIPPPTLISPATLLRTTLAQALLRHMVADPVAAATTYNAALDAATAAPLRILDDRVELPLWRIDADGDRAGQRLRAWDDDLPRFDEGRTSLMPRALLMTGLLRLAACDLFIHGSGGIAYDAAMERWLAAWLGVGVAPAALATATLRLPLATAERGAPDLDAARRAWREAYHDPEGLAGHSLSQARRLARPGPEKSGHLAAIAALPRGSAPRRRAWRAMHERLEAQRLDRADALRDRRLSLDLAIRQARERPLIDDRTWAFPLHGMDAMRELLGAIRRCCA